MNAHSKTDSLLARSFFWRHVRGVERGTRIVSNDKIVGVHRQNLSLRFSCSLALSISHFSPTCCCFCCVIHPLGLYFIHTRRWLLLLTALEIAILGEQIVREAQIHKQGQKSVASRCWSFARTKAIMSTGLPLRLAMARCVGVYPTNSSLTVKFYTATKISIGRCSCQQMLEGSLDRLYCGYLCTTKMFPLAKQNVVGGCSVQYQELPEPK